MIRKALILSIVVIFSLLVVQSVWLYKVIVNERADFRSKSEVALSSSLTHELDSRISRSFIKKNVNFQYSNVQNSKAGASDKKIVINENNSSIKVTMEQVFQDLLKNQIPLNLDSLSFYFTKELIANKNKANYILTLSDEDKESSLEVNNVKSLLFQNYSSFVLDIPLNASKSMSLSAKIYYPLFVYKGDFMIIGFASFILLIFIVFAIVLQFRMLSSQISLATLKENLTSFFTHELRSPLQSALSSLEMAEMYSDKAEVNSFLEMSRNKVMYINRLIEKLLDINKLEKNKVNLQKETFPLIEAVTPYLNQYFSRKDKDIEIETVFDSSLEITGDRIHITNALGNLIENAVKYSGENVHIKIDAELNSQYLSIIVEDNGIGIPEADQKKIFERFYRVRSVEHSHKGKGFGLGLNYVKWVALSHKGDVRVESKMGVGSKFILSVKS
ncbi:MAG: hypothetical protein CVT93_00880 [Bacteroidetes bacterium HGW-Bacteroidetes-10]|nr:MAG: hypothetical protein CVT93_00880 [Bacteroidetes bacterium HGW-Bacteroidetes-10]